MATRIFLIEDDDAVVTLVREGVEGEGWELQARRMAQGALEAVAAFRPDLLLLDLTLPDGDGIEILERLRADAALAKLPVIILTSKGDVESRLKGFAVGAQDYVPKPFDIREVLARISAHLALKQGRESLEDELLKAQLHERVRQDVIDMVVHDLRTPLATIKTTMDLIQRSGIIQKEPFNRYVDYAQNSVQYALLMVNDLLDLSAGKLKTSPAPLDVVALAERLETMFSLQYRDKKVDLSLDFPRTGRAVSTDATLVFRVLANLMSNALKFSSRGERVEVKALGAAAGLRLEVIDSGPGIPDAEKGQLFQKFYRTRISEAQAIPGSGIGLAFCRLAAETLGGRIWVEDARPRGSRFIMEVPPMAAAGG